MRSESAHATRSHSCFRTRRVVDTPLKRVGNGVRRTLAHMAWLDLGVSDSVLGAPRCDTRPLAEDRFELTVTGVLAPDWASRLTARLARLELSVVSGQASADALGFWTSRFEIVVSRTRDYGEFGKQSSVELETPPEDPGNVERHQCTPSEEHGGSLRLEIVEAPDCVGFLAALLWKLKQQQLSPVAFHVDTRDGKVFDTLWLKAAESRQPSNEDADALRRHLDSLVAS